MDEENTMHMMLKVVDQRNRTRYDTQTRQDVDIFDSVSDLREFLLQNYSAELSSPPDANSFRLGYIVGKTQRVSISNNSNFDEVYSSSKNGWITLWAEPIEKKGKGSNLSRGTKRTHRETLLDGSNEGIVHI